MNTWEKFEIQCTNFLNDRFSAYARFIHQGGAISTVPDILVETNTGSSFYIEVKHAPAQCGQFVLLPDPETKTFIYSPLNDICINKYSEIIINFMNNDFNAFKKAGSTGKTIDMPNSSNIFANWIISAYKEKKVRFFITNNYTILPIEHFLEYFNVTAKYRAKKSGSSNVGKKYINLVKDYILSHNYEIIQTRIEKDKLFVVSSQELKNNKFTLCGIEYMFSPRNNEYELRKLSKTKNSNVIFSIDYKASIPGISETKFINYLNEVTSSEN